MTETPHEELTLRDILEILKRHRAWLWTLPLLFGVAALIYGFFIAEPTYASAATVSVAPLEVQAQLEQRIQVQGQDLLTFQGLKAIALSEEVTRPVWEALKKEGRLPTRWQDQGNIPGLERMLRDFSVKDESPRQVQPLPQGRVPPVVASLRVEAPSPEVAAKAANLWAEGVVRRVNEIPLARLKASLLALEEQLAPAEKAYREAEARLEAFNRTTTLLQDQAELAAKTQERVDLDRELSGLERDLAAIRGRMAALEREALRQQGVVAPGLSPDQLALINRGLEEAKRAFKAETEKARQAFSQAAQALEAFKKREQIALWQAELSGYTASYADAQTRLLGIRKEVAQKEALLKEARARFQEYKAQVPNLSVEALVAGLTVKEAQGLVAERLKEADARLKAAEGAWEAFQRESRLEVLKRQLGGYADRVADIRKRLETLATDRARIQARLQEAEAELAKEPKVLVLERELAADPAVLALVAQGRDLASIAGLKLKNQELNPTHLKLLSTALDLRADLKALEAEEKALKEEEGRLVPQVEDLQRRIAEEENRKARILTELDVARDLYNAVYRYAENLKRLADKPDLVLREVSGDVLAQRDRIVALEAELAGLRAEQGALERNLQDLLARIQDRRARLAAQEREKEALTLEYATKKAAYEAFRTRYDQIAGLTAPDLTFDNPNPEYQRLRSALIDAQAEEARLLARKAALEARVRQVEARLEVLKARVARAQVEQSQLTQALGLAQNAYLALAQKKTDLQIEIASSQSALAQVLAPAYPVYEKVAPKRALIFAAALFLGLMLGVMTAFLAEALRPKEAALA